MFHTYTPRSNKLEFISRLIHIHDIDVYILLVQIENVHSYRRSMDLPRGQEQCGERLVC